MVFAWEGRQSTARSGTWLCGLVLYLSTAANAPAQVAAWHWEGGCNGRPVGSVWYGPEKNACGQLAMHRCLKKGSPLPPPTPCVGSQQARKPAENPPQRVARGGYLAEPAHDSPPMRDAPANTPQKQSNPQDQQPPTTLGAASPGQDNTPTAKTDQVAPADVPVPRLGDAAWSKSFPSNNTPAAFQLGQQGFDRLRLANTRTSEWIVDQAKDKGRDKGIETVIDHLPFSEAIRGQLTNLNDQVQKFKEMFEDKKKSAEEYVTGFFRVTRKGIECTGSVRIDCDKEGSDVETVKNDYGNREGKRWDSWLKKDVGDHVSVEDPRKP